MDKNRLLIIGQTPPRIGGKEQYVHQISSKLDCDLLTQKGSQSKNKIEIPVFGKNRYLKSFSFAIFSFLFLLKNSINKKYKTIAIQESLLYFLPIFFSWRYSFITTLHGITGMKFYEKKIIWGIAKLALKKNKKVVCVGEPDYEKLRVELKNVVLIKNGVDLTEFDKEKNIKIEKKMTYIGRINFQKGVDLLIQAFKELPDKKGFKLNIIGKTEDSSFDQILKNDKEILFLGEINDREKVVKELKSSYCLIFPSRFGEGLSLALLEQMASGRPIICSRLESTKILKNSALFFNPGDKGDLKAKMEYTIKNKIKIERLAKKSKKISKKYNLESTINSLSKLYGVKKIK